MITNNTITRPIKWYIPISGLIWKSRLLRYALIPLEWWFISLGESSWGMTADLSDAWLCIDRYFAKTIPHFKHSIPLSGWSKLHLGHLIILWLGDDWCNLSVTWAILADCGVGDFRKHQTEVRNFPGCTFMSYSESCSPGKQAFTAQIIFITRDLRAVNLRYHSKQFCWI